MHAYLSRPIALIGKIYRKANGILDKAAGLSQLIEIKSRGANCLFEGSGRIIDADRLTLGSEIFIGRNFFIRATGGIKIGSHTHISRNVTIHTVNHNVDGEALPYDHSVIQKSIVIGEHVWIGMNCSILPGISIGDGAIIGMNTVVSKNVDPGSIVVGSAQRIIGHRDMQKTMHLVSDKKFLKIKSSWKSNE